MSFKDPQTLNKQAFEVGLFSVGAQGGGGGLGAWPIALGPQIITYWAWNQWKYALCSFQCTQDDWNIPQSPGDIPVWGCGSQFVKYDHIGIQGKFWF